MNSPIMCSGGWSEDTPTHAETKMLCPICDSDEMQTIGGTMQASEKVLRLSELTRDAVGRISLRQILASERSGYVGGVEMAVYRAYEAQQEVLSEVAADVQRGQISPAKRETFTSIALSDIGAYRAIVGDMRPMVDLSERGIGGDGTEADLGNDGRTEAEIARLSEARAK